MKRFLFIGTLLALLVGCRKEYTYQISSLPIFEFNKVEFSNTAVVDTATHTFFQGVINGTTSTFGENDTDFSPEGNLELTNQDNVKRFRYIYKFTPSTQQQYQGFPEIYLPSFLTGNIRHYADSLQVGDVYNLSSPLAIANNNLGAAFSIKVPYKLKNKAGNESYETQIFYSNAEKQGKKSGMKIVSKEYKKIGVGRNVVDILLSINATLEDSQYNTLQVEDGFFKIRIQLL